MLEYRKASRTPNCTHTPATALPPTTKPSRAATAQRSGLSRLDQLDRELEKSLSAGSDTFDANTQARDEVNETTAAVSAEDAERRAAELDVIAVDDECRRWEGEGVLAGDELEDFDLLEYWQPQVSLPLSIYSSFRV